MSNFNIKFMQRLVVKQDIFFLLCAKVNVDTLAQQTNVFGWLNRWYDLPEDLVKVEQLVTSNISLKSNTYKNK